MLTRYGTKKIVRSALLVCTVCLVIGYALFATHDFILGPSLTVTEPVNGDSFTTPNIKIKGVVRRIRNITLNGRAITIDDKGNFSETVLLAPGYNVFELVVDDKFGRSKDYRLEYTYRVN